MILRKRAVSMVLSVALLVTQSAGALASDRVAHSREMLKSVAQHLETAPRPSLIAREKLLQRSVIVDVQLSPDGQRVAFVRRGLQQDDVYLKDVVQGTETRILADARNTRMSWSGDGRYLWFSDPAGLAVHDVATATTRRVLKWDVTRRQRFFGIDARAAEYAMINERVAQDDAHMYRYLLVNAVGETRLLHEATLPLRDVLLNEAGKLEYSAAYQGAEYDTVVRRHDVNGARELFRCRGIEQCRLVDYSDTEEKLWLISHHGGDKLVLQCWSGRKALLETVHSDPAGIADLTNILWNERASTWTAIAYHPDRRHWYGSGKTASKQLAVLHAHLPNANLNLSASRDGKHWLVQAQQSTWQFDRYFLYEPNGDTLRELFAAETAAAIPPDATRDALPVSYRARDGMLLHGYVYLPAGVPASEAPLVAFLHGGPFNRADGQFNPHVQLLANRGYVVFLPNFRASTGYGKDYVLASKGDFGAGAVLTDIFDGLDFLLALGIGDPERQAVAGHSFGGYAALLAASHAPERFAVAVAAATPVDFGWNMEWVDDNGGSAIPEDGPPAEIYFRHYGMPYSDPRWTLRMQQESPLANAGKVRTPLYIWAGAEDDRVPLKSIITYAAEAKRHGAPVSLLIDPDSAHSPNGRLSIEAFTWLMEAGMNEYFAGGLTPPSVELEAFLRKHLRSTGINPN